MRSTPSTAPASEPLAATLALRTVVLLSGAVLMSLEILGSRVLAPSYGSSVYVWGSLISTFLAALALGYALGGRAADRRPSVAALSVVLAIAAVLVLPCVVWAASLLETVGRFGWDTRWATLFVSTVLFLPPSVAMGMVTPFAVRIGIQRMESAGSVSGGYAALSTLGSIAGTLATTFFLIPRVSVGPMLLGLAGTLILCAFLLVRDRASTCIACLAGLTCGWTAASMAPPENVAGEIVLVRRDTAYHHILVKQIDTTRWFRFDHLTQSALNLARPDDSVLEYTEALLLALAVRPGIHRVCVIGLGGGWVPRALARIRPDIEVDSVEIDPVVREVAIEYFLYRESERVRTIIEDGRVFLSRAGPPYDLIVLDAYNSTGVPFHLTTREFFHVLRNRLTPDGLFAANFVGSLMGQDGKLFWAMYKTIHRQFGQVYATSSELAAGRGAGQGNLILFATVSADPIDVEILRRNTAELSRKARLTRLPAALEGWTHSPNPPAALPSDLPELTDAFAPIEALQHF